MEEKIREIVRDELSKYFCNIQNNEEKDFEYIASLEEKNDYLNNELAWRDKECKLLREENSKLKAKIEMYELTSGIDATRNCGRPPKSQPNKGGFNF